VAGEEVDVLTLERRDERAVQPLADLVRHDVGPTLHVLELARALVQPVERVHHLQQQVAALAHESGLLAKQDEEVLFAGEEREHRDLLTPARGVEARAVSEGRGSDSTAPAIPATQRDWTAGPVAARRGYSGRTGLARARDTMRWMSCRYESPAARAALANSSFSAISGFGFASSM